MGSLAGQRLRLMSAASPILSNVSMMAARAPLGHEPAVVLLDMSGGLFGDLIILKLHQTEDPHQ